MVAVRAVRPLTIGIAGGTASGKTTVARRLVERLAGHAIAFLDQDAYYRDLADVPLEERKAFNFDHPDAFDTDLLVAHLRDLQAGRAVAHLGERKAFTSHPPAASAPALLGALLRDLRGGRAVKKPVYSFAQHTR